MAIFTGDMMCCKAYSHEKSHTFLTEYGIAYFVFATFSGTLALLYPIIQVSYFVNGLGITYRGVGEALTSKFSIYSTTVTGCVSDR